MIVPIKLKGRSVKPHKAIGNPILSSKNVLTNSPWDFVELWLKKEKKINALFYWNQAKEFHKASKGLPTQSSPLLHYYSFMNGVKALLSAKSIVFNEYHGVTHHKVHSSINKISLTNEGVKIKAAGVLPSLSTYLGETETSNTHSLKELLFNLPYIHRTYCLSYSTQTDMYIPIKNAEFVYDSANNTAYFRAKLSIDFANMHVIRRLPSMFIRENAGSDDYVIKSSISVPFSRPNRPTEQDINHLLSLHRQVRAELSYIDGSETLWYIKSTVAGPSKISRHPMTITLAAMHRLSELSRYKPIELDSFLTSQKNWLLSEFIQQAPLQFFDEIASEITGHQLLTPNVRGAN